MNPKGLLILGYGGNGRSIGDVALASRIPDLLYVDGNAKEGERFEGFPVVGEWKKALPEGWQAMPGSGDNRKRQEQVEWIRSMGWPLATVVAPGATLGVGSVLGPGTFVAHHAHVGPRTRIGTGCILNTASVVDHDCVVGDYTHVSGRAGVAGNCRIGDFVLIGGAAGVIDNITVVSETIVGAGGMVVRSIDRPGTYVGVPARLLPPRP